MDATEQINNLIAKGYRLFEIVGAPTAFTLDEMIRARREWRELVRDIDAKAL